ncbi:UBP-type zinc finger domain-containing protein, partial [Blastococcus sp. KM273129]|uniref:UBP-type zinc finger domain-containing protein n=1 Tax=Blastococcus sp. KM273129 TaxID=2570315 RepID=UPI001F26BC1A
MTAPAIDPEVPPSGTGCVECEADGGWWFHLRRCARCGHIGCCDSSPSRHARAHAAATGHPVVCSFEPGEESQQPMCPHRAQRRRWNHQPPSASHS